MPIHDIIDNRNHRLADHINCILATLEFRLRSASAFGVNTQIVSLQRTWSHVENDEERHAHVQRGLAMLR